MKEIRNHERLENYIKKFGLEDIFNESLRQHLSLYTFEKGDLICTQEEDSQYLYVLVEGKVKIFTNSAQGKTLILSFKTPLEIIGDLEYIQGIEFINTVEAVSPVCMIGIHFRWLKKYGSNHAPLLHFLLTIITKKFHMKSNSMSFNLMYPVEVRLASYLLAISCAESDTYFNSKVSINLKDAANLIGTSYRHLNRVLTHFCDEVLIERHKGTILLKNIEALKELAGDNIYEKV